MALLWAFKLGSFPGILFALLLSMPAAYFLLGRQREQLVQAMNERREEKAAVRRRLRGDQEQSRASDRESDREQESE